MKYLLSLLLISSFANAKEYIVRSTDKTQIRTFSTQVKVLKTLKNFNAVVVNLDDEKEVERLRAQGFIVEENGKMHALVVSKSAVATKEIPWGITAIKSQQANKLSKGAGQGITVCVVDTGIANDHKDLKNQVVGGQAFAKGTIKDKPEWYDDDGHGTHVSGTIAAKGGRGIVGVAPKAKLYAIKVLDNTGSGTFADVADGIKAAIGNCKVMNISLGASVPSKIVQDALIETKAAGIYAACAAGNNGGKVGYPAAYPECIAVSASTEANGLASFSSRGPEVDFIAPGAKIKSTVPGGGYETWDGTSMATPHVAGTLAIMLSRTRPELKGDSINLPVEQQGGGLINAHKTALKK